jgi:hypothetical protein
MLVAVDDEQPSLFLIGTGDGRVTNEVHLEGVPKAAQIARYAPDNSLIAVSSLNSDLVSLIGPSSGSKQRSRLAVSRWAWHSAVTNCSLPATVTGPFTSSIFRSSLQSTTSAPTRAVNPLGFSRAHGGLEGDVGQRQAMLNRSAL